jgi:predicted glycoside hydrolase/deacetylase ChbG (UPF0249 family)
MTESPYRHSDGAEPGVSKRLIVTADDVGLDEGMTAGALRAHRDGIVTACSLVANGRAFDDAVARLRDVPSLEVGVHLALVEELALTTGKPMARNYVEFLMLRRGVDVEKELRAQLERVLATGLPVTHLNGHQHLHGVPAVFRIVRRLADEYGIRYIRTPRDRGGKAGLARRLAVSALGMLTPRGTNDRTIGIAEAGHLKAERLIELLDYVDGVTELVTHPGIHVGGYAHWRYEWDAETAALCDPRVREAIAAKGIALVGPSAAARE